MYYPYFITYVLSGLIIALLVFIWSLKNGQFSDQRRARFLPLEEDNNPVVNQDRKKKFEIYAVIFILIAGVVSSIAILVYALLSH